MSPLRINKTHLIIPTIGIALAAVMYTTLIVFDPKVPVEDAPGIRKKNKKTDFFRRIIENQLKKKK